MSQKPRYACSYGLCTKDFLTSGQLTVHNETHDYNGKYRCVRCNYTTDNRTGYNTHINHHTRGEQTFKCPYEGCGFAAGKQASIKAHIQSRHPNREIVYDAEIVGEFENSLSEDLVVVNPKPTVPQQPQLIIDSHSMNSTFPPEAITHLHNLQRQLNAVPPKVVSNVVPTQPAPPRIVSNVVPITSSQPVPPKVIVSTQPAPVQPAPLKVIVSTQPAPVQPAPVQPAPVQPAPLKVIVSTQPAPVQPAPPKIVSNVVSITSSQPAPLKIVSNVVPVAPVKPVFPANMMCNPDSVFPDVSTANINFFPFTVIKCGECNFICGSDASLLAHYRTSKHHANGVLPVYLSRCSTGGCEHMCSDPNDMLKHLITHNKVVSLIPCHNGPRFNRLFINVLSRERAVPYDGQYTDD